MDGYDDTSYGEGFADVYDEWYDGISDIDVTVATLLDLAGRGPVLELGVGTGRLAVPLALAGASSGVTVVGIDTSEAMLDRLAARDPDGLVGVERTSMEGALPGGPHTLAFVAYNTLFNLTDRDRQAACFAAVADVLGPGGRFVVEAFVPWTDTDAGSDVTVRSLTADRVVLSVSVRQPDLQVAEGQFIEISESGGVRLRPWSIRYAAPAELDEMATAAGMTLEHRWESFARDPFTGDSERHVSVYLRP